MAATVAISEAHGLFSTATAVEGVAPQPSGEQADSGTRPSAYASLARGVLTSAP